jgi:hypothetical protein
VRESGGVNKERKKERKEERKKGRKEERKKGRKEERKKGRKEVKSYRIFCGLARGFRIYFFEHR